MYFVYVLRNGINKHLYKGVTKDLNKRIKEHNQGKHKYTSQYCPWEIAYYEEFENFSDARAREFFLKSGAGREFLRRVLEKSI
jgi:putative endonuclease